MKLTGSRVLFWSGIGVVIGFIPGFLGETALKALGPLVAAMSWIGSLAFLGLIAGFIMVATGKKNADEVVQINRIKFWAGLVLAICGAALPAFFVYEMLFVPGGGDAIFLVMIFGPFGLVAIAGGIWIMVRNRAKKRA